MAGISLPAVIGPTENALRALLPIVLAPSGIRSYEEWVALNIAAADLPSAETVQAIATALKTSSERVMETVGALRSRELFDDQHQLTPEGNAQLRTARHAVTEMTQDLLRGIDEADLHLTVRVLDTVRQHAEAELAARATE